MVNTLEKSKMKSDPRFNPSEYYRSLFETVNNNDLQSNYTPFEVVKEMCSKLEIKDTDKILVLYNVEFATFLVSEMGVKQSQITIYNNSKVKSQLLEMAEYNVIYQKVFDKNKDITNMKFDVVIGNPPYQKDEHSSQKLWKSFLINAVEKHVNKNGIVSFVIPTSWTKPVRSTVRGEDKKLSEIVRNNTILDYNLNVNEHFNVGINISTVTLLCDKKPNGMDFMHQDVLGSSIFKKLINSEHPRLELLHYAKTPWNRGITRKKQMDETYNIKLVEGKNKYSYCNVDDISIRGLNKIHIPRIFGFNFIPDAGEFGLGYQAECILLKESENLDSAMSFFNSNLITKLLKCVKWIPQADYSVLEMLPRLNYNVNYSDSDLYNIFNLTQEEINYIENAIK